MAPALAGGLLLLLLLLPAVTFASDAGSPRRASAEPKWGTVAVPLRMVNLNPFHLLYGVPASAGARVLPPDASEWIVSLDLASYLSEATAAPADAQPAALLDADRVLLDGETYRLGLAWRQGFAERFEYLVEVSAVAHSGGVFDRFIEGWHDFFGLPQGRRDEVPHDRLAIYYRDAGGARLNIHKDRFALGDLSLGLGYAVPAGPWSNDGLAVRASVKLPTGDADALAGSGGWSASAWAETSGALPGAALSRRWLYAATVGVLAGERPRGLRDIGGRFIAYGRFGVTWRALERMTLTVQVDVYSSPWRAAALPPLAHPAVMIGMGGAVRLTPNTTLDIAVTEDDGVHRSAPDIGLHVALRWTR